MVVKELFILFNIDRKWEVVKFEVLVVLLWFIIFLNYKEVSVDVMVSDGVMLLLL